MQKTHVFVLTAVLGLAGMLYAAGPAPASAGESVKPAAACSDNHAGQCQNAADEHAKAGCCSDGAECCSDGGSACCAS